MSRDYFVQDTYVQASPGIFIILISDLTAVAMLELGVGKKGSYVHTEIETIDGNIIKKNDQQAQYCPVPFR
jgi:hypothetical protein